MRLELKIYDISHQCKSINQSINRKFCARLLYIYTNVISVRHVNPEVFNKSYSTPKSLWNSSSNLPFDLYVWQKRYRGEKGEKKEKERKKETTTTTTTTTRREQKNYRESNSDKNLIIADEKRKEGREGGRIVCICLPYPTVR